MPYQEVYEPPAGPEAFAATGDAETLAQAAIMLMLGMELRGDDYALYGRAAAAGVQAATEAVPLTDRERFPVPRLQTHGTRVPPERARFFLTDRYGAAALPEAPGPAFRQDVASDLALRLYTDREAQTAAQLLEYHLYHPDPLLRVAAATSLFELTAQPARLVAVLAEGTESEEELVREVAATALGRLDPTHPRLAALAAEGPAPGGGPPSQTSLLVHGTWARHASWWQPGGDFHEYVRAEVRPDLYGAADRFHWTGYYSDFHRAAAATELTAWITAHEMSRPNLFCHSHGGSVAMLASQQDGMSLGHLVLLSCPVHVHKYLPEFASIWKVVSIRVHLDLVLLADRAGQRFWHPQISENVLPLWFDHAATHHPHVWRDHNVRDML